MSARTTVGGRRILASYPLLEPLVHVTIEEDVETKKIRYVVHEPRLSKDDRRLMQLILQILEEELILTRESIPETKEDAAKLLHKAIKEIVQKYHLLNLKKEEDRQRFERIAYYIVRDHIYLGRIYPLLLDERIEDISCAGPGLPIYVWHEDYEFIPTNIVYRSDEELDSFIVRLAYLARRQISLANPLLDAALPDGSRIQLSYGREVTKRGSSFTIRRSRSTPLTIVNIVRLNTLSSEMGAYVWFLLEHKRSIMVAGPTACGKTTTLNCFTMFFRPDIKIVSIEETPELQLAHENWLQSVARRGFGTGESFIGEVTLFDLLKAAMRQRPDFIIVGEIRGAEAYTLFQAIATGHGGMCTIHADSAEAAIHRLTSPPMNIPHPLLPNMNLLCVQIRTHLGRKVVRRLVRMVEINEYDPQRGLLTNDVFRWDPARDRFIYAGRSYLIERLQREFGYTHEYVETELKRRKTVIDWLVKSRIDQPSEIRKVIRSYYIDPEKTYQRALAGLSKK